MCENYQPHKTSHITGKIKKQPLNDFFPLVVRLITEKESYLLRNIYRNL